MGITATFEPATTAPVVTRARQRHWLRWVVLAALAAAVTTELPTVIASLTSAAAAAAQASPAWLVAGLAATVASMVAFGALRQRTLAAANGHVSLAEATSVSYAAGAVHLTAPAGSVFSTAYAFRTLRERGLTPAAITFSLAVSGVISALALAALALTGIVGGSASWTVIVPGLAGAIALGVVAGWAVRHPHAVARAAERLLRTANRLLRRPVDAGVLTLRAAVDDLAYVRPSVRDWLVSALAAAANWGLDLLCLWACAHAVGISVTPVALLGSYALAMAGAGASPLPGGVGIVDGVLLVGLTAAGAPVGAALGAVLLYRLLSNGSVIAIGWTRILFTSKRGTRASAGTPQVVTNVRP